MLAKCRPYVIGKGLQDPFDLSPGDRVYTLSHDLKIETTPIESVATDFYEGKVNIVKSGQNQSISTPTTRFMYVTGDLDYKIKMATWPEIDRITPNKEALPSKYLPVLSFLDEHEREYTDIQLDGLARSIYLGSLTYENSYATISNMRGQDAIVLITLMEEYFSDSPGKGKFGRASVKDRLFFIRQKWLVDELARLAVLSGYTAQTFYTERSWGLQVNFESTPVPGSIPKNQKYYKEPFADYVFAINANNLPILGMSVNKWCFMSTAEG